MKELTCIILLGLFCFSFKERKISEPERPQSSGDRNYTLKYGVDSLQALDLFVPANHSVDSTPVLVLIHGGGWMSGDKNEFVPYYQRIKSLLPNYAIANLNYRLYKKGRNKFPAQEGDVKAAIEYLMAHSAEYRVSKKFAIYGISSGAQLATLYAYKYGRTSYRPFAVIDNSGPVDLIMQFDSSRGGPRSWIYSVAGNRHSHDSLIYLRSSPINFVNAVSVPTLILQGGADKYVVQKQAEMLDQKLTRFNVDHKYIIYPGEGHGLSVATFINSWDEVQWFLNAHMP